jgi:hypothetical protein
VFDVGLKVFFALGAAGDEVAHGIADAAHPFLDLLFVGEGEAEAELLLSTTVDMEGFAGDEGDVLFAGLTQEGACAQFAGEAAPEVKAAIGGVDADTGGPMRLDGLQHEIAFVLIDCAQGGKVVFE